MARRHIVTRHTLGHWRFDGAAAEDEPDDSGYENTALDLATPPLTASEVRNPFGDGSRSRIVQEVVGWGDSFKITPVPPEWDAQAALTVAGWFYLSDATYNLFGNPIIQVRDGADYPFRLELNRQDLGFEVSAGLRTAGPVNMWTDSDEALAVGWHHACGVFDGAAGTLKLYVDKVLKDTDTGGGATTVLATGNVEFGNANRSTHANLQGNLSDIIVESVARDADWVAGVYDGSDGKGISLVAAGFELGIPGRGSKVGSTRWPT